MCSLFWKYSMEECHNWGVVLGPQTKAHCLDVGWYGLGHRGGSGSLSLSPARPDAGGGGKGACPVGQGPRPDCSQRPRRAAFGPNPAAHGPPQASAPGPLAGARNTTGSAQTSPATSGCRPGCKKKYLLQPPMRKSSVFLANFIPENPKNAQSWRFWLGLRADPHCSPRVVGWSNTNPTGRCLDGLQTSRPPPGAILKLRPGPPTVGWQRPCGAAAPSAAKQRRTGGGGWRVPLVNPGPGSSIAHHRRQQNTLLHGCIHAHGHCVYTFSYSNNHPPPKGHVFESFFGSLAKKCTAVSPDQRTGSCLPWVAVTSGVHGFGGNS